MITFLLQAIPIPNECKVDMKETFERCAESESIELTEIPKHSDIKQVWMTLTFHR